MMENCRPDVVQVAQQSENTAFLFVVPNLNFVVISSGHEEGLLRVEADATDRAVVLVELLQQRAHAVVPQLDDAIVQT